MIPNGEEFKGEDLNIRDSLYRTIKARMLLFRMLMKYINNLLLNKQLFLGVLYQRLAVLRNSFFKYKLHVTKKNTANDFCFSF